MAIFFIFLIKVGGYSTAGSPDACIIFVAAAAFSIRNGADVILFSRIYRRRRSHSIVLTNRINIMSDLYASRILILSFPTIYRDIPKLRFQNHFRSKSIVHCSKIARSANLINTRIMFYNILYTCIYGYNDDTHHVLNVCVYKYYNYHTSFCMRKASRGVSTNFSIVYRVYRCTSGRGSDVYASGILFNVYAAAADELGRKFRRNYVCRLQIYRVARTKSYCCTDLQASESICPR